MSTYETFTKRKYGMTSECKNMKKKKKDIALCTPHEQRKKKT